MGNKLFRAGSLLCFMGAAALPATADVSFEFAQGDLKAKVTFIVAGDTLTILLENTATVDVGVPTDVLTGVYFDIDGFGGGELTPVSALLANILGTPVLFGAGMGNTGVGYNDYEGDGDIGSEVGYDRGASALGSVGDHAIAHVGLGNLIGADDRFDSTDSHNLQGPLSPNGIEYGIVNAGYTGGGNTPVDGPNALATTAVVYTLTGFTGFSEGDIGNVSVNYGTDFNPIPAPTASILAMLGFGMIMLRWSMRPAP